MSGTVVSRVSYQPLCLYSYLNVFYTHSGTTSIDVPSGLFPYIESDPRPQQVFQKDLLYWRLDFSLSLSRSVSTPPSRKVCLPHRIRFCTPKSRDGLKWRTSLVILCPWPSTPSSPPPPFSSSLTLPWSLGTPSRTKNWHSVTPRKLSKIRLLSVSLNVKSL